MLRCLAILNCGIELMFAFDLLRWITVSKDYISLARLEQWNFHLLPWNFAWNAFCVNLLVGILLISISGCKTDPYCVVNFRVTTKNMAPVWSMSCEYCTEPRLVSIATLILWFDIRWYTWFVFFYLSLFNSIRNDRHIHREIRPQKPISTWNVAWQTLLDQSPVEGEKVLPFFFWCLVIYNWSRQQCRVRDYFVHTS